MSVCDGTVHRRAFSVATETMSAGRAAARSSLACLVHGRTHATVRLAHARRHAKPRCVLTSTRRATRGKGPPDRFGSRGIGTFGATHARMRRYNARIRHLGHHPCMYATVQCTGQTPATHACMRRYNARVRQPRPMHVCDGTMHG